MKKLPELNKNEIDTLVNAHKQMLSTKPEGQAVALDPSNTLHKKLILTALKAAGQTKDKYPHLYHAIDSGQFSTEGEPDKMIVVDAGADANGHAIAHTWLANNKGTLYSGSSLFVMDGTAGELLAHGAATDVHSGLMQSHTDAQTAKKAGESVRVLGVNHMVGHDGTVRFTAVAGTRMVDVTTFSCSVTVPQPSSTHSSNTFVIIGVGRTAGLNPDVDYYYTESSNQNDPYLIVPFEGTATLPYQILSGTTGSNVEINASIAVDYGGTNAQMVYLSSYTTPTDIAAGITIDTSNNTISWSYPCDNKSASTTTSLVFENGPANDILSYIYMQFSVPVTGTLTGTYIFTVYSQYTGTNPANPPENVTGQGYNIYPVKFTWHCLAKGTQVTMADGGYMKIEDVNNNHRVRTGSHGADIGVEATTLGHHESDAKQTGLQGVYRLRTTCGKELVATGAHPIMTPNGGKMICHLIAGDAVLVAEGVSTVAGCEAIDYAGMFYDLKLGNASDRAVFGQNPVCSYHANGIEVGDHNALNNQTDRQRYDLDYILPRIGADFRVDYANAVQDRFRQ